MASVPDSLIGPPTATEAEPPVARDAAAAESPPAPGGEPVFLIDPPQGQWTIEQWTGLGDDAPRAEYIDGCLEVLTVPRISHLLIQAKLTEMFRARLGWSRVFDNGLKLQIGRNRGRIPDVIVLRSDLTSSEEESLDATAVQLVVEVISPGRRQRDRDLREKREDYAAAGIDEYWIVDPDALTLLQLRLEGGQYNEVKTSVAGDVVMTPHIGGLSVSLSELFAVTN